MAFLSRHPPLLGYTSVASRAHTTDVTGDREVFRRVTDVMSDVAEALKATVSASGYASMSFGGYQGNAPVHWH